MRLQLVLLGHDLCSVVGHRRGQALDAKERGQEKTHTHTHTHRGSREAKETKVAPGQPSLGLLYRAVGETRREEKRRGARP